MSDIKTYYLQEANAPMIKKPYMGGNVVQVREIIEYLNKSLPILQREFDDLDSKNKVHYNEIFHTKMLALSNLFHIVEILNEWYIEKSKNY